MYLNFFKHVYKENSLKSTYKNRFQENVFGQ